MKQGDRVRLIGEPLRWAYEVKGRTGVIEVMGKDLLEGFALVRLEPNPEDDYPRPKRPTVEVRLKDLEPMEPQAELFKTPEPRKGDPA